MAGQTDRMRAEFFRGARCREGRAIVDAIRSVPAIVLLDRESDADHNRSVLTFAGPPEAVAKRPLSRGGESRGVDRPRITTAACIRASARRTWCRSSPSKASQSRNASKSPSASAQRSGADTRCPSISMKLPRAVRSARTSRTSAAASSKASARRCVTNPARAPDIGEPELHPTAGATVVGRAKVSDRVQRQAGYRRRRDRQTHRQGHSVFIRRIPLRESHGRAARVPQSRAGFHEPHRFRADAHAPRVRNCAQRRRSGTARRSWGARSSA